MITIIFMIVLIALFIFSQRSHSAKVIDFDWTVQQATDTNQHSKKKKQRHYVRQLSNTVWPNSTAPSQKKNPHPPALIIIHRTEAGFKVREGGGGCGGGGGMSPSHSPKHLLAPRCVTPAVTPRIATHAWATFHQTHSRRTPPTGIVCVCVFVVVVVLCHRVTNRFFASHLNIFGPELLCKIGNFVWAPFHGTKKETHKMKPSQSQRNTY